MKTKKIKIGIVGCGAIGSYLAKAIARDFRDKAVLAYLCDSNTEKAEALREKIGRKPAIVPLERLIREADFILEAASAKISAQIAEAALRRHKIVLIMSVGGLFHGDLKRAAARSRGTLLIPSGALAGIDGLLAAGEGKIRSVRLVTRKPAEALRGAPYFQSREFPAVAGGGETTVFKGTAREAVKGFPQNVNVAALLGLAGIGPDKTEIEIRASADSKRNQHELIVEAETGEVRSLTVNLPSPDNPKTSLLAAYSAVACLRKFFSPVRLGT